MDRTGTQATQPELEALEDSLSEKDEDPGVQDGVEGVEAEGEEVPHLSAVWDDGLSEASDHERQGAHGHDDGHEGQQNQVVNFILSCSRGRYKRAMVASLLAVHVIEAESDGAVAEEDGGHQQGHETGVGQGEGTAARLSGTHADEAPAPGAILLMLAQAQQGQ